MTTNSAASAYFLDDSDDGQCSILVPLPFESEYLILELIVGEGWAKWVLGWAEWSFEVGQA